MQILVVCAKAAEVSVMEHLQYSTSIAASDLTGKPVRAKIHFGANNNVLADECVISKV